jgi:phosphoribosylformylglycinamidine cyclo-ligase
MSPEKHSYEQRGVSPHKPDVKAATAQLDKGLFPGAFCAASPDIFGHSEAHCLLSHADGAGTKSSLAYLHYLKHGDASIFEGIAQDSLVMNTDDLLCVGAVGPYILSNTIGRNAKKVPGEVVTAIIRGYKQTVEMLAAHGIEVTIAGGETADVGDLVRTLIVDSSLTTRMERARFIDASQVRAGQVIVGLASDGRAGYEAKPNSGVGSNGLTALRHDLLHKKYREETPETFAPEIGEVAYTGTFYIDDPVPGLNMTVGEALLSPTRTYAPIVKKILDTGKDGISAIFHNTGGGQTKCLNFGRGIHYIKDGLLPLAPFFEFVRYATGASWRDMLRTYNCGTRMEIVCDEGRAAEIIDIAESYNVKAKIVGRTEAAAQNKLTVETPEGAIEF